MNRTIRVAASLAVATFALTAAACPDRGGPSAPDPGSPPLLLSVDPAGGATDVPVDRPVTVEFDHAMAIGMEAYADVHEGNLAASPVEGTWVWSAGRTRLSFTPATPFEPGTVYLVHLGGGMTDAGGRGVDLARHGAAMGGDWATGAMMSGGTPGAGGMGDGMHEGGPYAGHTGEGWEHADGTYGMFFAFRTAG